MHFGRDGTGGGLERRSFLCVAEPSSKHNQHFGRKHGVSHAGGLRDAIPKMANCLLVIAVLSGGANMPSLADCADRGLHRTEQSFRSLHVRHMSYLMPKSGGVLSSPRNSD